MEIFAKQKELKELALKRYAEEIISRFEIDYAYDTEEKLKWTKESLINYYKENKNNLINHIFLKESVIDIPIYFELFVDGVPIGEIDVLTLASEEEIIERTLEVFDKVPF
jgi:CRISPR/Cas system-associated exonuclease Cas4 (RecB family)